MNREWDAMGIWECTVLHRLYSYCNSDSLFPFKDCESTKQGGFLTMTWGFHAQGQLLVWNITCAHPCRVLVLISNFLFYKRSSEEFNVHNCLRWQGEERGSIVFEASSLPSADPIEISLTFSPCVDIVNVRSVMATHYMCPLHLQIHGPFITILHVTGWD